MTGQEFAQAAKKVFGNKHGWQARMAEAVGINRTTVYRWSRMANVPPLVEFAVMGLTVAEKRRLEPTPSQE